MKFDYTEKEMEQFRKAEYEQGATWQIHWDIQAEKLKRAADIILNAYDAAIAFRGSGSTLTPKGGEGWAKHCDGQLIGIYYMLMGLAVENLFKGIIMVNHPRYLTPDGITEIDKHETYDFLEYPDLKNELREFKRYEAILKELAEYVKWKAKYPVSKLYKDFDNSDAPIDRMQLIELYDTLSKRAWRERRPEILRGHGISILFGQFINVQKEIVDFIKPKSNGDPNKITMKDIQNAFPRYKKELVISVLEDYAKEVMVDTDAKQDLLSTVMRWELGFDDESLALNNV
jgi:hypothetical protein